MTDVCKLDTYERIAGDTTGVSFRLKNHSNLKGYNIIYTIYNTREDRVEVKKENLPFTNNIIYVDLDCVDTKNLKGTYLQTVELFGEDKFGEQQHYTLCQGQVKFTQRGNCK